MKLRLAILAVLVGSVLPVFAQIPLNTPSGIICDSQSNLYVANYGRNQTLIYNPQLVQVPRSAGVCLVRTAWRSTPWAISTFQTGRAMRSP